jgi:lipopolysaccharide biosynthesis regulator YciM
VDGLGSSILFALGLLGSAGIVLYAISRADRRPAPPDPYRAALDHLLRNDMDAALESLQRTIRTADAPPDAYIQLGNLLRARGEHRAALQIHQTLTVRRDLRPDERAGMLRALVEDHRALGQRAEALRTLEALVVLRRDARVLQELAREALAVGRTEDALAHMRAAQALDPALDRGAMAVFLAAVAEQCLKRDRPADAKRFLQLAQKEDDTCPQALDLLGDMARSEGDRESALYYWQKLVFAGNTPALDVHEKLEKVYFDLGKFGEIERVYAQVLEKRPRDLATLLAAARICLKKGEAAEAERLLGTALEVAPQSNAALQLLAGLWLDEGKHREVRELLASHLESCQATSALVCPDCGERRARQPGYCSSCGRFGAYVPA